jgi:hypothetical protein
VAGISPQVLSRIERGEALGSTPLRTLARLGEALDASISVTLRWRGEELDRLMDAAHARLVDASVRLLESRGWETRVEVSFNHYGDRGRVDLLARHPRVGVVVVAEVKTAIGDLQETLGKLDVKTRLGRTLAASVGWEAPKAIVPALILADSRAARRHVAAHAALFARFGTRGRQAMGWLSRPGVDLGPGAGLLWFAGGTDSRGTGVRRNTRVRTRAGRS